MAIYEALLPELEMEAATTRKFFERLPEDKLDFRPHEKSMPLGRLAGHVAELVGWGTTTLETDQLDFAPVRAPQGDRPGFHEAVDLALGRKSLLHHAAHYGRSLHGLQPHHPPPRPTRRLLPPEQRPLAVVLRTLSRRTPKLSLCGRGHSCPRGHKGGDKDGDLVFREYSAKTTGQGCSGRSVASIGASIAITAIHCPRRCSCITIRPPRISAMASGARSRW